MFSKSHSPSSKDNAPPFSPENLYTPENCQSPARIKSFLRLSRFATDDTIREHINGDSNHCDHYFQTKIVPQWNLRSKLIQYCSDYAIELHQTTQLDKIHVELDPSNLDVRLDPYAVKSYNDKFEDRFAQSNGIRNWTQNELTVESIVRDQTVSVLNDKCSYKDWMGQFKEAQRESKKPPRRM
ncbi:hypothetical protein CLIB1423_04S03928 [[Candida] railenensis]|uniref:Uncharacterized protein n=1 Tax=[Candida] railenensis TaxID=45579 RepID=A0A9P0VX66_9ASCO|nr:hypothetical protein CLIB1423_04S03928 [[Candida] railenensis]